MIFYLNLKLKILIYYIKGYIEPWNLNGVGNLIYSGSDGIIMAECGMTGQIQCV